MTGEAGRGLGGQETLRARLRMSALVVMHEVDAYDAALATAAALAAVREVLAHD